MPTGFLDGGARGGDAAGAWHSIVSLTPGSVFLEVKEGPYEPKHAGVFAPWSPAPDDPGVAVFLAALERAASGGNDAR